MVEGRAGELHRPPNFTETAGSARPTLLTDVKFKGKLRLMSMTDGELRGIILQWFYERRRAGVVTPKPEDFDPHIPLEEIDRICHQLDEKELLDWAGKYAPPEPDFGKWPPDPPKLLYKYGRITGCGSDVIEGNAIPLIAINLNVQLSFSFIISNLISQIEQANASEEEKKIAKSRLKTFLEHPLVTSVLGGLAGELIRILGV